MYIEILHINGLTSLEYYLYILLYILFFMIDDIIVFVVAMIINTYCGLPAGVSETIVYIAKRALVVTLFFIGASLSVKMIKSVGIKPLVLAILLWIIIGVSSFFVVKATIV